MKEVESVPLSKVKMILYRHNKNIIDVDPSVHVEMVIIVHAEMQKLLKLNNDGGQQMTMEGLCKLFENPDEEAMKAYRYEIEEPEAYKRLMDL
jgi:hypothetical protein